MRRMKPLPKIRLEKIDQSPIVQGRAEYQARLAELQVRMLSIQQAFFHGRRRGIVVVEGWDAAGKGGMIRRLTESLDQRSIRVWPIGPPEPNEQARHYLYRFWTRLPEPGTLAIFDRSWYGRVLVERVEKLTDAEAWKRGYDEINAFEHELIADGVKLVKIFLHITPDEQLRRYAERLSNPYKRWKLTTADLRSHKLWDRYVKAAEEMFVRTSTREVPWTAVAANHKWSARIASIDAIADGLSEGIDLAPPPIDEDLRRAALRLLGDGLEADELPKVLASPPKSAKPLKRKR